MINTLGLHGDFSDETAVPWDDGLTDEQRAAASVDGQPSRMLAGPGTGKTLVMTRRILYLVQEHQVTPDSILAITFTRGATFELARRVRAGVGEGVGLPRIATLHSFALRQLVKNSDAMTDFRGDIRIADDWEERQIITEDLKGLLREDVKAIEEKFRKLSSDWETLSADQEGWERSFPDPRFLKAWTEHRTIFEYVMRNELVYRLKRAVDELGSDFNLEAAEHLIVDEYQDLNQCDLAVIQALIDRGAVPYVAGDDDQSIYGFRHAFPLAIRQFPQAHQPCADPRLTVCKRCDARVLELGLFVAGQDYDREEKVIQPESGGRPGHVAILRFADQFAEARGIARLSQTLVRDGELREHDILILLRSDKNRAFSRVLVEAFDAAGIPVIAQSGETPLETDTGRRTLAMLRLAKNTDDSLALRTVLQLTVGIGGHTLQKIYGLARGGNVSFATAVRQVVQDPTTLGAKGMLVASVCNEAWKIAMEVGEELADADEPSPDLLLTKVIGLAEVFGTDPGDLADLKRYLGAIVRPAQASDLSGLFQALQSAGDDVEQNIERGKVNILTMHKAKGLTAAAVFVVGCDDRLMPGRNFQEPEVGDERRLLYVSLTRAEHYLFPSYCVHRLMQQSHSGREESGPRRLTRFLQDGPVVPTDGLAFARDFAAPTAAGAVHAEVR